ncbi:probable methyltransferase TARBP1 isoform X7 [Halyomorpha halys]|uniref:probable methyltransferase TARBP1 isoform X7 n=1 Tax=Halyomorpha halys TaxID=286706 RepID=UPI0006D51A84|nr:probable methyltransferase TARBP1 isoform X5 [Halyomorpha halys]
MRTNNSCIPISDVFDLLEKITYNEEKTVDKLLQCTVSDLKGDRSIVNLKALNYFLLFRSNCKGISIYSYENVIYESVDLLKYISDKDITICALLGSVIENCLPLIPMTNINKVFLKLVEFIETNLQFMSGKVIDQADNYTKLAHSLHVLERTCSFKSGNPTDLELPTMLNTTLISLIPNLAIDVARKIFVSVLPKFVLSQDSNIILEQIWLQLTRLNFSENDVSKQLFYLCLLSDNFITVEHNKLCFPLYDKPEFWEIILKGLYNEDSIIRKQSLFLLKLYIEKLAEHNPSIEQDIFYWDNKHKFQLIEFWNKIFTFLEVVEEKQTHLITPALKGFEDLHSLCSVNRKYAVKIMDLGEELTGLVNIFFYHCEKLNFIPQFSAIISKGIVFGAILRKDKRMEMEVSDYIMNLIESGSMESFGSGIILKTDREVRLKVLHLLLTLSNVEHRNHLIVKVIQELISYDEELTKNNNRYFNDSLIHRKKNKLLQAILILENYIYLNPSYQLEDLPEIIYNWTLQSIISCSQQPSIRYQLEWLFMRLTIHYPLFLASFWNNFSMAGNERLGSMCSFISIAYHLSVVLNENKFIEQCVEHILPWCMSQNFNIRLYAQILLGKLWNLCPELSTKYHCISKNQWKMYEHEGNMLVNAKKMENDFYFRVFHPINHFTLQTIYWDLPRLSNICVEEWIHPDILRKYSDLCIQNVSEDHNKSLTSCISPVWIIKNSANSDDKIDGTNIQKKFLPTQAMFESHGENINTQKGGLILVASLVDKAANLGGLARTCEVFAAKELVVSNLDVTKEKEFISLSMTAEKHLRISEVKSYNLAEYLKSMKKMGYILIGAEQTTGSVSLTSYHFPEQCVLLLGSEKEGIPPNLLPLLEDYIEIPQLGLVRSLNVHVTGAIFLWEYSKQHSLCNR